MLTKHFHAPSMWENAQRLKLPIFDLISNISLHIWKKKNFCVTSVIAMHVNMHFYNVIDRYHPLLHFICKIIFYYPMPHNTRSSQWQDGERYSIQCLGCIFFSGFVSLRKTLRKFNGDVMLLVVNAQTTTIFDRHKIIFVYLSYSCTTYFRMGTKKIYFITSLSYKFDRERTLSILGALSRFLDWIQSHLFPHGILFLS